VPTVFNFLGPLANPARARRQVVGVSDPLMAEKMMGVLVSNGAIHAIVVHGHDGLDELSTTAPTEVWEFSRAGASEGSSPRIRRYVVDALDLGLPRATIDDLRGGDADHNAEVVRRVLSGAHGAHRDVVVLNGAAGLVAAGLAADLFEGVKTAAAVIDDGRAERVLDGLIRVSCAQASEGG
jgi:anthranilate phosphoribosyltransferase